MAAVIGVLADYARGEASESDVVRALLAHDGWYAPMLWLNEVFGIRAVDPADRAAVLQRLDAMTRAA